jgi:hypothetical protein
LEEKSAIRLVAALLQSRVTAATKFPRWISLYFRMVLMAHEVSAARLLERSVKTLLRRSDAPFRVI